MGTGFNDLGSGVDNTKGIIVSGTDTYTATNTFTAYNIGDSIVCTFTNACTGASTLNLNGLGAKAIKRNGSLPLNANDILAGQAYSLVYDGTDYQLLGRISYKFKRSFYTYNLVGLKFDS